MPLLTVGAWCQDKLRERFPSSTFDYNCLVGAVDSSSGGSHQGGGFAPLHTADTLAAGPAAGMRKVVLDGLEPFAERVLSFLQAAIEKQYPLSATTVTPAEELAFASESQLELLPAVIVGRDEQVRHGGPAQ
jgi:hypothetical protein